MKDFGLERAQDLRHLKRDLERRARTSIGAIRELVVYAHGAIVHLKTDQDPVAVLEDLVADVREFLSTRARGGK